MRCFSRSGFVHSLCAVYVPIAYIFMYIIILPDYFHAAIHLGCINSHDCTHLSLLPFQCLWKNRVKLSGAFAKQRVQCGVSQLAGLVTGAKKQSLALVQSLPHHARVVVQDDQPEECMVRL